MMFIHFVERFGVQSQNKCLIMAIFVYDGNVNGSTIINYIEQFLAPSINLTLAKAMLMEAPEKFKFIEV